MKQIPMSSPDITQVEISAVDQVMHTPILSIGPQVGAFESRFVSYVGAPYACAVNSGTSGLHLGVIASGIKDGDLAITSPFSFVASANVILYERAIPIFVDVEESTGNIDPALIQECLHDLARSRTAASRWLPAAILDPKFVLDKLKLLLPVHAFGQPADMDPILRAGSEYQIPILEDACEALGAEYKNQKVGTFGKAAVFAFYPNKQMTTGEGGMIVTSEKNWVELFFSLRNQGRDVFDSWLKHSRLGYNYRLDELSSALGLAQISRIEQLLEKRERVAHWYNNRLQTCEHLRIPQIAPTTTRMSWFVYVIRIDSSIDRTAVMQKLEEKGVPSRPYFSPIHLQPFFRDRFGYKPGDFPITEKLGSISLALPFSSIMTEEMVEYVCRTLIDICHNIQ